MWFDFRKSWKHARSIIKLIFSVESRMPVQKLICVGETNEKQKQQMSSDCEAKWLAVGKSRKYRYSLPKSYVSIENQECPYNNHCFQSCQFDCPETGAHLAQNFENISVFVLVCCVPSGFLCFLQKSCFCNGIRDCRPKGLVWTRNTYVFTMC
jgi:hypothetical protein